MHESVTSRVDVCNSLVWSARSTYQQSATCFNAAAGLVCHAPRHCHVTPFLRELHWLPVGKQIHNKNLLFTFKTIHGKSPVYLQELISLKTGAYWLRSSPNGLLLEPPYLPTWATWSDRSFSSSRAKILERPAARNPLYLWYREFANSSPQSSLKKFRCFDVLEPLKKSQTLLNKLR